MSGLGRRTIRMPDNLLVTLLRLDSHVTVPALRAILAADWYVLLGHTTSPTGGPTGYGGYVGTSDALGAQTVRVGVSLRTWTYKHGRLQPDTVVLIRRPDRPIGEDPRLLVEAAIARAISAAGYTVLNQRTAAPTAAARATRNERLWANEVADRLSRIIRGRLLAAHAPGAVGGNTREQLVRLILTQEPACGMDVDDLLDAARAAGIHIAGTEPQQRSRRDVTTRELSSGRPRVYRTWIRGRTIVYPAGMRRRDAVATYRNRHPQIAGVNAVRRPSTRLPTAPRRRPGRAA